MAWTAPRTWVSGEVVTAAVMNAHLRDNMLETEAAKLTATWDLPVGAAANALTRLPWPGAGVTAMLQSTPSGGVAWPMAPAAGLPIVLGTSGIGYAGFPAGPSVFKSFGSSAAFLPPSAFTPPADFQDLTIEDGGLVFARRSLYKTADTTVSNSTALIADAELQWQLPANTVWHFDADLYITVSGGDPGFRFILFPAAAASGNMLGTFGPTDFGGAIGNGVAFNTSIGLGIGRGIAWTTSVIPNGVLILRGFIAMGATPGQVYFEWAQNTAVGSTVLKRGSGFRLQRVA